MADVVQHSVVDGLPDVPDRPLHVGRRDDLMGPRRVLVGGQDPDFPPGHLLLVDVHRLKATARESDGDPWQSANTETQVRRGPLGLSELVMLQLTEV